MKRRRASRGVGAWLAVAAIAAGTFAAACGGDAVPEDTDAVDREMELAMEEGDPELRDEGQVESPGEATPRPAPPPAPAAAPGPAPPPAPPAAPPAAPEPEPDVADPEPEVADPEPEIRYVDLVARAGSELEIELRQELSTKTNQPGDRFTASVVRPLVDGNLVIVPVNSIVHGEVTAVQKSGGSGQEAIIKVTFHDVMFNGERWPLSASVVQATPETEGRYSTGDKAARIGAGAVAGAILGRVIGGNTKGTVIGAAVGAAAGTAITLATEDVDAVLPEGSLLRLRLDEPLTVTIPDSGS